MLWSTVFGVTFIPAQRSKDAAIAAKMSFNRSTQDLAEVVAWLKLVSSVIKQKVLYPFKTSTLPANLIGKGASTKNLIKFTCANETSALSVNDHMAAWDCATILTIPDIGDKHLTMSKIQNSA